MVKTVIVDDEPLAVEFLSAILKEVPSIEIVAECADGASAVEAVLLHEAELLFLDIQMPDMNGFDVIRALQTDLFPMVIFTTAHAEYAIDAFGVNAVDYVLKPLEDVRVQQAAKKAIEQKDFFRQKESRKPEMMKMLEVISERVSGDIKTQTQPKEDIFHDEQQSLVLSIKDHGKVTMVLKSDIRWFEAAGDYICVHTDKMSYTMRSTMKDIERKLNPDIFCRIHRSTIVNQSFVREIKSLPKGEAIVTLDNKEMLKVSRNYRTALQHFIA